ncbi:MAG: molybdopterin cofactor-binding domain-containing protein, partial [Chitinophagaceae bacterium]
MNSNIQNSRRSFLKNLSITGGGLILGISMLEDAVALPHIFQPEEIDLIGFNSYVSIGSDGIINIFSPNPELGQNIRTSFGMIVADELDADWNNVRVLQPMLDARYERQLTGGSGAIPHSWKRLRTAGASAKLLLMTAAAQQWNVPLEECIGENSFVIHKPSGKKLSYGSLASAASKMTLPSEVKLKDPKEFKLIGKNIRNVENKNIITGKGVFGIDFKRDGMVYATIKRPPAYGLKIKSFDATEAKAVPGVEDVVAFKNNVAIVGKSTWDVLKAKEKVKVEYEKDKDLESDEDHNRIFSTLMDSDKAIVRRKDGDVETAFKNAAKIIKSEYQCPFIPHNPIEPMNFFAHVKEDSVELIGPTQTPASARKAVSDLLKIPESKITVEITRLGGGFGRRLKFDYVVEAS